MRIYKEKTYLIADIKTNTNTTLVADDICDSCCNGSSLRVCADGELLCNATANEQKHPRSTLDKILELFQHKHGNMNGSHGLRANERVALVEIGLQEFLPTVLGRQENRFLNTLLTFLCANHEEVVWDCWIVSVGARSLDEWSKVLGWWLYKYGDA